MSRSPWSFALISGLIVGVVFGLAFLIATATASLEQSGGTFGDWLLTLGEVALRLGPFVLAIAIATWLTAAILPALLYPVLRRRRRVVARLAFGLLFAVVPAAVLAWAATYPNPFWIVALLMIVAAVAVLATAASAIFPRSSS